jgi:hypothetical protein
MSKILKGSAFTYGTKTDGTALSVSINGGTAISIFPTELRLSYEGDTNTATNSNGEVISHCSYNQRKVLNLTGIVSGTDVSNADSNFATTFLVGQSLDIDLTEWAEVDDGSGNYIITSAEKTRSSSNYAEWTIAAIEYENVTN